jgi:acetylcholinesterase
LEVWVEFSNPSVYRKRLMPHFQAHATDLVDSFGPGELRDYVIHFTNNLDPNGDLGLGIPWPKWDPRNPKAVIFQDSTLFPAVIGDDNYRTDPLSFVANMSLLYPI